MSDPVAPTAPVPAPVPGRSAGKGVLRQSSLTSVIALIAVLSGLGLDLCIAAAFGAGAETDAFVVAARLPLGLSAVVMVMANQVLVPGFTTWATTLPSAIRRRVETATLLGVIGIIALFAGLVAVLAGPLANVMAPGFEDAQTDLAARLIRVMVWYLPCVAGAEVLRCWLNSRMSFAVPAAMTLVLNVVAVSVILLSPARIEIVVWAYVAGSVAQLGVLSLVAYRKGMRLARPAWRHPEVRRTARMSIRPALGAGLNPLVRVAELFFASFLPAGSATILHYGNRLASAVGGTIIFRSVIVALLPRLTRAFARGAVSDFDHLVRLGLRIMLFVALPMGFLGAVLAPDTTSLVFGVGRFDERSAALLGTVMALYALSFPGSGIQRALLAPFFARRDTKTPWRNTVYGALANVALLPLLVLPFGGGSTAMYGVALAYGAAQCVNVAHAWWRLRRSVDTDLSPVLPDLVRSAIGAVLAGLGAWAVLVLTPAASGKIALALHVVAAALAGLALYGATLLTDRRVRTVLVRRLPRRKGKGPLRKPPRGIRPLRRRSGRRSVRRRTPPNGSSTVTLVTKPPTEDHHVSRR